MFNIRNILVFIAIVLLSTLLSYSYKIYLHSNPNSFFDQSFPQKTTPQVVIENTIIEVDIARTYEEKDKGLGGREKLGNNEGMLFIFDYKNIPTFWMKGMLIPLDIIWISDNKIVDLDKNVKISKPGTPDFNLTKFSPKEPVNYVLEVNAGFSDENNIEIGNNVQLLNI